MMVVLLIQILHLEFLHLDRVLLQEAQLLFQIMLPMILEDLVMLVI